MEMGFRWDFAYENFASNVVGNFKYYNCCWGRICNCFSCWVVFFTWPKNPSKIVNAIKRNCRIYTFNTAVNTIIFCLLCTSPIWNQVISLDLWNDYYWLAFWNIFVRGLSRCTGGVSKTQWEACRALNFSTVYTYRKIVLPQAFPIAIPGMGNYLVGIFKDTPLLSTIGVAELFHAATAVGGYNYRYLEPYTMVGIIFLTLSIPAAMWVRKLGPKVNIAQGKTKQ